MNNGIVIFNLNDPEVKTLGSNPPLTVLREYTINVFTCSDYVWSYIFELVFEIRSPVALLFHIK